LPALSLSSVGEQKLMKHNSVATLLSHPATPSSREAHRSNPAHWRATRIRRTLSAAFIVLSIVTAFAAFGVPVNTSWTYQGQLQRSGAAYTGTCDFQFSLWDAVSAGTQQGGTQSINGVNVVNGLFTVVLDFGIGNTAFFTGDARWLGTSVQCSGDGGFTPLDPRQPITAAPYALSLRPGAEITGPGATSASAPGTLTVLNTEGGIGVQGSGGIGLLGHTLAGGYGVYGLSDGGPDSAGVIGVSSNGGVGIWGRSVGSGAAIYGENLFNGYAGQFAGPVVVQGNLFVQGTLSKSAGSFRIDHPLDPEHKFLSHSFVESPDMMNIYNGNVTTDATGSAIVTLPAYFDALNRDFRYQLTVLGQFAQAIVSREIAGNSFEIHTDKPGVKVSWQVTGIRQDAYALEHPIVVEESKPAREQGLYLYPAGFGAGEEKQLGAPSRPAPAQDAPCPTGPGPSDQGANR
jgi:hypothetical protein